MYPDRLYELAFAFRKTKLWKYLYDSDLFAVSLPNGEIGYCSIMGLLGEHLALALYVGNKGLDSYRLLLDLGERNMSPLKAQEFMLAQNCLQCSFESKDALTPQELSSARAYAAAHGLTIRGAKAFPQLLRYQPAHYPWPISGQEDLQLIGTALEAALAVSETLKHTQKAQLGFSGDSAQDRSIPLLTASEEGFIWSLHPLPPRETVQYPEPVLRDDLLRARLKKMKRRRGIWVCDVVMVPHPTMIDEASAPVFPYMLLTAVRETETVLPTEIAPDLESGAELLLGALGNQMLEHGIPKTIQVTDQRTCALLKNLAEQLGIRLALQPENELLDEMEENLLEYFDTQEPEMIEDEIMLFSEIFMALDDATLLTMPDDLWGQLYSLACQGILDEDTAKRIQKLEKRRK